MSHSQQVGYIEGAKGCFFFLRGTHWSWYPCVGSSWWEILDRAMFQNSLHSMLLRGHFSGKEVNLYLMIYLMQVQGEFHVHLELGLDRRWNQAIPNIFDTYVIISHHILPYFIIVYHILSYFIISWFPKILVTSDTSSLDALTRPVSICLWCMFKTSIVCLRSIRKPAWSGTQDWQMAALSLTI